MALYSENYSELLRRIAASIRCTELAAFNLNEIGPSLEIVYHVRPDGNSAQVQAAINAFKDIVGPCIKQGKDGAIEIINSNRSSLPQFCLVILARRAGKIVGAAAFILRCKNLKAAMQVLKRIQTEALRFRNGPPKYE
jgi:hypothetical protein